MFVQIRTLFETFVAIRPQTFEWFLIGVCEIVFVQIRRLGEPHATVWPIARILLGRCIRGAAMLLIVVSIVDLFRPSATTFKFGGDD